MEEIEGTMKAPCRGWLRELERQDKRYEQVLCSQEGIRKSSGTMVAETLPVEDRSR